MTVPPASPEVPSFAFKMVRAEAHLIAMDLEIATWRKSDPCRIIFEPQPDSTHYLVRAVDLKPLPASFGLILGDTLQCLRTSLDHLVWQLTSDYSGIPETGQGRIEFPVHWGEGSFNDRGQRAIAGIHPDAQSIITQLQPFHSGDRYTDSLLYRLHELNNRDKHRALMVTAMTGEVTRIHIPGVFNMFMGGLLAGPSPLGQRLDENPVLGFVLRLPGLPDPAEVDYETTVVVDIAIDEAPWPLTEWSQFFRTLTDWLFGNVIEPLVPFLGISGPNRPTA
jgi:hypothetical protein